ncbi:class I SAM-dependent methyltransferase [Motiliproteus sp. MSK22-1]|uniref:class I SAM-dependent methyltransferase n=1 Tax=Motiliproteus sp. MSK22-1 TaxID=1897630 RepID=UPI0009754940|nr:class I SAM-dependent methyltransferase [Motiliproteus sp. MSK22-1]OMH38300.1 hypothetical protein BGP75_08635 [Motiliproteus sp. MSK22-1]
MIHVNADLQHHYSQALNPESLLAEVDRLIPYAARPEDFAPIDQLHLGGRGPTIALLDNLNIKSHHSVLDVGCGLGGSARLIAERYQCSVIGVDITSEFCQLATALNKRLAQTLPVSFIQADATCLPFSSRCFDLLISQHCMMNLPNPLQALTEFRKLLTKDGLLILHEVLQGDGGPAHYPVPWASNEEHSFLIDETTLKDRLTTAGFQINQFTDHSQQALSWRKHHQHSRQQRKQPADLQAADKRPKHPRSPLSPELIFGERFSEMTRNLLANLAEGRVKVVSVILR